MRLNWLLGTCLAGSLMLPVAAQPSQPSPPAPAPPERPAEELILEGDLRVRVENWDWFDPGGAPQDDYTYGHGRLRTRIGWRDPGNLELMLELQDVQLVGVPEGAVGPGAIGQMGTGGSVFAHAGRADHNQLGVRQGYLKVGRAESLQAQLGRMEYSSAMEVVPKDPALAALKRSRLKDRLIGTFDFSPYGRTFDGVRLDGDTGELHVTGFAAWPTQGGFEPAFDVGMDRVFVSDLSLTVKNGELLPEGEAQVFWVHYDDDRPVPQLDNRPPAVRGTIAGTGGNHLETVGFHFIHKLGDDADALLWYAHQEGSWGLQSHRADAMSAELGYRFPQGGVRGGYAWYSGDPNPGDGVHETFYPMLPTIRMYALTPFYTESNLRDGFLQLTFKPQDATSLRMDVHWLSLDQAADLWYAGSGATRSTGAINGFAGRPSGGSTDLGTLLDLGVDHQLDANQKLSAYFGHVFGGSVIRATYPANPDGNFFFVEYNLKF